MRSVVNCIVNVLLQVKGIVNVTTLTSRQYCVIVNPVGADGKNQLGKKKLIKGESSFFIRPGEQLEKGIQVVYCSLNVARSPRFWKKK